MPTDPGVAVASQIRRGPPPPSVKPDLQHVEPPHPVLQAAGVNTGVQQFNQQVQEVVDAHQRAYGTTPSPGLTLDVIRAQVPAEKLPDLFSVPKSPIQARAQQSLASHQQQDPYDFFHHRDDLQVAHTPVTDVLHGGVPLSPEKLQQTHPWVPKESGFLPLNDFGSFLHAVGTLLASGKIEAGNGQVTVGGKTLAQYQNEQSLSAGIGGQGLPIVGATGALKAASDAAAQTGAEGEKAFQVTRAVRTVKVAQEELKQNFPAFYANLAADGNFNQDWVRATARFQSSATYYRSATKQLAKDNHFDNPADFVHAWKAKQQAIRSDPTGAAFYQHVPLAFFGNGQSVLNFYDGDTHGWGFLNVPTVALDAVVGAGKTVFFGGSAVSSGAKANAAAAVDFFHRVLPTYLGGKGEGGKEAAERSNKILLENPTWLRIVYPGLPAHPTGALGAVDQLTNFALDMTLGNRLMVGGPAIKAGDRAALNSHRYFKSATQLAFNSMKKRGIDGVGEASKLVQGGEGLNVAAAEKIKAGEMSLGQYREHVADLYHTGMTDVVVPPVPRTDYYYNQFGMAFPKRLLAGSRTEATNLTDAAGHTVGSVVFDARPGRARVYIESVYIAPEHRNIANFKRLLDPLMADGRPIEAEFQNARLEKLFKRFADQRGVGDSIMEKRGDLSVVKGAEEPRQPIPAPEPQSQTIHAGDTPNGTVLRSLRAKNLPNPNLRAAQIRKATADFTDGVANSGYQGVSNAANLVGSVGRLFTRAAPRAGEKRWFYDPKTPDDIFNWTVKNIGDRELAYQARNDFVVARANEDVPAIQKLNESLNERYAAEHPNVKGKPSPIESSGPETEAESLAYFKFLGGREKALSDKRTARAFDRLRNQAVARNNGLNRIGAVQRQAIIAGEPLPGIPFPGGESLFWKHTVADTARRWAGGGGLRFGLSKAQTAAKADAEGFFKLNPSALRAHSANRAGAETGEVAWINRDRPQEYLNFNTGDVFGDVAKLEGAGAHVRHLVTDDALNAYRQSTPGNKTALFRYVWHSSFYQNKIAASDDFAKDAAEIKRLTSAGQHQTQLLSDLKKSYAQDWVEHLYGQYRAVDAAGEKAGVPGAVEQLAQVAVQHPGAKIDKALGQFIGDNKLAFDVKEAPVKASQWDSFSQWWTGKLLTFNKKNRVTFFDHVFYDTYSELAKAGWERGDAVTAASDLAKAQTIHHMLDFSNMLQVEQNLRWLSYYATKHRLYWTWIGKQFARKPLLAAAVNDVAQHLDKSGNYDLNVRLFGHELAIPVARLFWVNNTEYPQTSPPVETGARTVGNLFKGQNPGNAIANAFAAEVATSGNVIGRDDQAIAMWAKAAGMAGGWVPATFGTAVEGMSPVQRASFNDEMHHFILGYRADHDGRYPSEGDAVRGAVLRSAALETHRANLFVPVVPLNSRPNEIQKLIQRFGNLTDPAARRKFLDAHPAITDYFGASGDQDIYLHEQPLWDAFNKLNADRDAQLAKIRLQIDQHGYTVETAKQVKAVSAAYSVKIQQLRQQDALTWKGDTTYPAGKVADNGEITQRGPWSTKLDGDPTASKAFLHETFPDISKGQLDQHTIGQTVVDLQNEATRIRQLGWQKLGYPDAQHAKDRVSQINQKLSVFRSMPKNATSQMVDAYYKDYVDPYIQARDKLTAEQAKTSSADKNVVYALNRAIKEHYDHPVTVIDPVNGKKTVWPSPVSFGFTMLTPDLYHTALAGAISGRWQDVTGYEKTLLGIKTPPHVADGWAQYQESVAAFRQQNPGARFSAPALARQIDKNYPGFYKDFLFSQQPKIDRYERTVLYQNLGPTVRTGFDTVIAANAKAIANAIKANKHTTEYMAAWRTYVKDTIDPWLAEPAQKALRAEIARYGPDFLNTLPSK